MLEDAGTRRGDAPSAQCATAELPSVLRAHRSARASPSAARCERSAASTDTDERSSSVIEPPAHATSTATSDGQRGVVDPQARLRPPSSTKPGRPSRATHAQITAPCARAMTECRFDPERALAQRRICSIPATHEEATAPSPICASERVRRGKFPSPRARLGQLVLERFRREDRREPVIRRAPPPMMSPPAARAIRAISAPVKARPPPPPPPPLAARSK